MILIDRRDKTNPYTNPESYLQLKVRDGEVQGLDTQNELRDQFETTKSFGVNFI